MLNAGEEKTNDGKAARREATEIKEKGRENVAGEEIKYVKSAR